MAILAVAVALYVPYSLRSPQGPRGGCIPGLIYGSVGFAFMLFAGLLGLRKKIPHLEIRSSADLDAWTSVARPPRVPL